MLNKFRVCIGMLLLSCMTLSYAQPDFLEPNGFGQTIQIQTAFNSWVGKPMWLLEIRDLDHGINIPYLFDISRGSNFFVPLTGGRNYLILGSSIQMPSYRSCINDYCNYRIRNFCNLESNGRINRGESMFVSISGRLSPNRNTYTCHVSKFRETNFNVYTPCCSS